MNASDSLAVSWPISSLAGEVLVDWPHGFHWMLSRLQNSSPVTEQGRVARAFGGLYKALYVGLGDTAFDWIRDAFEDYLAENWSGALGKQNRRTADNVLARLRWLPAPTAASELGVSVRRIQLLIESGQLHARYRTTKSGRQYVVVRKDDVENLREGLSTELSLESAALRLGISRHRLSRLLPQICPGAVKVTARGSAWAIPLTWVSTLETRIDQLPALQPEDARSARSFDHLLRHYPFDDVAVARLLLDFEESTLKANGRLQGRIGLAAVLFPLSTLSSYFPESSKVPSGLLSIPEVAQRLLVKQEVAYKIVRSGFLPTISHRVGRRSCQLVEERRVDEFLQSFVLARDLAHQFGISPKAVIVKLRDIGTIPVLGPNIDGCRQTIYRRKDVDESLELSKLFDSCRTIHSAHSKLIAAHAALRPLSGN
ncbi:hypothetical protein [Hydrogenophaga sp. PBL-H3]|uniref:hypothetical protein n=1 Tax=Hydrogenophaga sp. PBL-H3 TaxID=434010 RepID=UPI00131F7271|nr:hypothetical protein [Hydrogenophaga sp. PBL-H3]QHE74550.1 hypothetical protein F9Z45_00095 [Hydrogenophaga sp. PBL-H3]QHE78975.1 hypothetical protein F9Z44_00095 [Hydrogenophaga sp. PBL-H3]